MFRSSRGLRSGACTIRSLAVLVLFTACSRSGGDSPTAPTLTPGASIESGNLQAGRVGEVLTAPLVVRVADANGSPLKGQIVRFVVVSGGGIVDNDSVSTGLNGQATARWSLGTSVADSQRVEARLGADLTSATLVGVFKANAQPGAAQLAAVAGGGQIGAPNGLLADSLTARVADQYGNPIAGVVVTWSTSGSGAGTLAPAQGTSGASGYVRAKWTLGSALGAQTATAASVGLGAVSFLATAQTVVTPPGLSVTLTGPGANELVADTVKIRATVTSTFQLASVRALLGGNTINLTNNGSGVWFSNSPVTALAYGLQEIVVTATDVQNSVVSKSVTFIHDVAPTITITAPTAAAVAGPNIAIKASCSSLDSTGCVKLEASVNGTTIAAGLTSLDATVSLASWEGQLVTLLFTATDQVGNVSTKSTTVNVYTNPQLQLVTSVPGAVMDVRGTRTYYWVNTGTQLLAKLQDGATTTILFSHNPKSTAMRGALTANGAFFVVDTASGTFQLREYVNGTAQTVSAYSGTSVGWAFAGEWVAWSDANRVVYRRSIGGQTVNTGTTASTVLDINALGDVVAATFGEVAFASATGSASKRTLDSDIIGTFSDVHIDNVRAMWSFLGPCCISRGVQLRMVVGTGAVQNVTPYININSNKAPCCIQTVNGWYGYATPSATGELQVFAVSPTGVSTQVSKFFVDSKLEALGANGEVLFASNGSRYYSTSPYTSVTSLGTVRGTPIYRDGKFLILLANTVYRVP